ncbi:MAG TPA: class I SAM-dependent methyltransferase [Longimicrobiales bacterium]|nr:class I SAM-dependent methyltransferase [Longimicrobiales bacterium]
MSAAREGPKAFDEIAGDYEAQLMRGLSLSGESLEYFAAGRTEFLRAWWRREGCPEPGRILDYGCGIGLGTSHLARRFPRSEVLGLDPSERSIERAAREQADHRIHFDLLEPVSSKSETADLIHLNGVVHHVPPEARPRLFDDIAARLSPGGVVAVFENNPLNPGTRWVMSRIPFDRDAMPVLAPEARRCLKAAGLIPLVTRYLFYFPRSLRLLRPLEALLDRVPLAAQYCVLARSAA